MSCIQWLKDTNLKANHNTFIFHNIIILAVFNGSKILIWKQITTWYNMLYAYCGCIQWLKDTNLKANHNFVFCVCCLLSAVFNGSKILIWKQITTCISVDQCMWCCIQWLKDTNLKANHNCFATPLIRQTAVFNGSKILIWKQITTFGNGYISSFVLYSMAQRY